MNLYLDDDSAKTALVKLLRKVGHQVAIPTDVGMAGVSDPRHLMHAIQKNWVLLTGTMTIIKTCTCCCRPPGGNMPAF